MVKKSNNWNLQEMQETLVRDTEQRISQGFGEIAETARIDTPVPSVSGDFIAGPAVHSATSPNEPKKGVQTYIPISQYRRLNNIKLTRRENIAALVAQAIGLWLDVQDGKQRVEKL